MSFIIQKDTIEKEFYSTSWEKECDHYAAVMQKAASNDPENVTDNDISNANAFAYAMNNALDVMRRIPKRLENYFSTRRAMAESGVSTDEFERMFLGNIKTGAYSFSPTLKENIPSMECYGYVPRITKIVSDEPYTIIFFNDGTEVRVKCDPDEPFDEKMGVYMALLKKAYGSANLQHIFKLLANAQCSKTSSNKTCETTAADTEPIPDGMETVNIDNWDKPDKTFLTASNWDKNNTAE